MVKLILAIFCSLSSLLSIFADNPKTIFLISLTSLSCKENPASNPKKTPAT
uniref:Uncharacterized protein n=1 Tax=Populus trichocarpa TaxID=3694 RepID=A0A3N7EPI7_POPTR